MLLDQLLQLSFTLLNQLLELSVALVESESTVAANRPSFFLFFSIQFLLVCLVLSGELSEAAAVGADPRGELGYLEEIFALTVVVEELLGPLGFLGESFDLSLLHQAQPMVHCFKFSLVLVNHILHLTDLLT